MNDHIKNEVLVSDSNWRKIVNDLSRKLEEKKNEQTTTGMEYEENVQHFNKDGSLDMRYKANRIHLKPNCNKDGSLDMRLKVNRESLLKKKSE